MAVINRVSAIELTTFNAALLNPAVFLPINPLGLPEACFMIRILNTSNVVVIVSYDGILEQDVVPANTSIQLPFQSNSAVPGHIAYLAKGTIVYLEGNPGVGGIALVGYYQKNI